jgi:hypothetical protein
MRRKHRVSLFVAASVLVISSVAKAEDVDFDTKVAAQRLSERKTTIDTALKYAWSVSGRERFGLPELSFQESAKLDAACNLLGEYGAEEAVRMGFFTIDQRISTFRTAMIPFSDFPCVRMLIKIGNPSVSFLIRNMKVSWYKGELRPYHKNKLRLEAYILREIDGHEVGLFRLQEALKAYKGKNKPLLHELIEIYKLRETEFDIKRAMFGPIPEAKAKKPD